MCSLAVALPVPTVDNGFFQSWFWEASAKDFWENVYGL